jgi:CRISPR system Cascade subunit CasA
MNVAFDPWIPVVTGTGERKLASLSEILSRGGTFADLAVRPHERVSLMRLFLCVAHAALDGPKNYTEWREVPKRLPDAVLKYLMHWKDSFELFHKDKPWLQIARLNPIPTNGGESDSDNHGWSPLSRLCFTRASGINTTLFDHASNGGPLTEYPVEEIVLNLLTFQNFFVAGGKASSRLWGTVEMKNPPNPKGGPCSGKSILFTFLRGKNLIDSIHLNLNTYEDLKTLYGEANGWLGRPLWEIPIKSPTDHAALLNATQTHIGRLVPQTRILRVNENKQQILLGSGFLYPKFQDEKNSFYPDPFATVVLNKNKERMVLSAKPNRAIWRELHSLVIRNKSASSSSRGALCLFNIPDGSSCDIVVSAMITNPKQAAEIVDLLESVFHVPAQLFTEAGIAAYESEVDSSELMANRLGSAVEVYRKEMDCRWEDRLKSAGSGKWELKQKFDSVAAIHYWTTVENNLSFLTDHVGAIGTDEAIPNRDKWRKMLFATACESYRIACGRETPQIGRAHV